MICTEYGSLVGLMQFKSIEGQLAHWLELSQFDMEIIHRNGKKHSNADGLARIPDTLESCDCYQAGSSLESLPCKGYLFCSHAHGQWD